MPNRFIFSLRFSTKVFAKLGVLALALVIFMTLFRLNLYFLSVFHVVTNAVFVEVAQAFIAGLRFDLLVFGFLFIPIYFTLMLQAILEKWPRSMFVLYKTYFLLAWFIICTLSFVDFLHFAKFGQRMRFQDYMALNPEVIAEQFYALSDNRAWVFAVITFFLFALGYILVRSLKFGDWKDEYSPDTGTKIEIVWRLILPMLLIGLAARGTIEAHHLALEHSEVSLNKTINELALNAVWCFDK